MADLKDRIIRAAKLDVALYEEVRFVPSHLATGSNSGRISRRRGRNQARGNQRVELQTLAALIGGYVWGYLTYLDQDKKIAYTHTRCAPPNHCR